MFSFHFNEAKFDIFLSPLSLYLRSDPNGFSKNAWRTEWYSVKKIDSYHNAYIFQYYVFLSCASLK